MKKILFLFLVLLIGLSSVCMVWAAEEKDHICFRVIDADKNGAVTHEEFEKFYKNQPETFKTCDVNKDNILSHDEYHDFLGHGASETSACPNKHKK